MLLPEHLYHRADDVISRDVLLSTCRLDRVVSPVFFPGTIKHIRDVLRKTT